MAMPLLSRYFFCIFSYWVIGVSQNAMAEELKARGEANWRYGNERSILMTELWGPLAQSEDAVVYADYRMMGDSTDNEEMNIGFGYREAIDQTLLGEAVVGVNGWFDRRVSQSGSVFHQMTFGGEWLGDPLDIRINAYVPLSDERYQFVSNTNPQAATFVGTGVYMDTDGITVEEPQHGLDLELGWELGHNVDFLAKHTDSFRIYGGGYYFNGDHTDDIAGYRSRVAVDMNQNIQLGARFQRDDERGSQTFLEATFRFPFGNKKSFRGNGTHARLDESPERDIDIVTADKLADAGHHVQVFDKVSARPLEVLHVDNSAPGGGDGSADHPYNSLVAATAAAGTYDVIYVNQGNGTDSNQNQGIILDKTGQKLIGTGADFVYDSRYFATANGAPPSSALIAAATAAPVISNSNVNGDGITVSADDVVISGVTVDGAARDGIAVISDGATASATNTVINDVTVQNNRMGINLRAANGGAVSAKVENVTATSNSQHGIVVYDDTNDEFDVDLGGGAMGSAGRNILTGNGMEDLAIDYDGRALSAQNNWWGQGGGPIAGNIYYGIPMNDNLVMHWTFDDGTAVDRSGNAYNGTLMNTPTAVGGSMDFDAASTEYIQGVDVNESDTGSELSVLFFATPETLVTTQTFIAKWSYFNIGSDNTWGIRADNADPTNFMVFVADTNDQGQNYLITSNANLVTAQRQHIAYIFDGSGGTNADRLKMYKDANQLNGSFTGTIPTTLQGTSEVIRVGEAMLSNPAYGQPYNGLLDDIRIYNRALTQAEIAELYRMNTSSTVDSSGALSSSP